MKYKIGAAFLLTIFMLYACLSAIISFLTPIESTRNIVVNSIVQSARYDYKANLLPNSFYSNEKLALPDNAIFSKITKSIYVDLNYSITAQAPVQVNGMRSIILTIAAEQLWRKDWVILQPTPIDERGTDIDLFREQTFVDIGWVQSYIDAVEKEVQVKPLKYTVKISPKFEGVIVYGAQKIPYEVTLEPTFELSSNVIKPADKREFSKETVLDQQTTTLKKIRVLGKKLEVRQARFIFGFISTALLVLLIIVCMHIRKTKRSFESEVQQIDKRYRKRLIPLADHVQLGVPQPLYLQSIEALVQLADERDLGIFRHSGGSTNQIFYYVFDGNFIYSYSASPLAPDSSNKTTNVLGKDLSL